jgi:hypothetical protein
MRTVGGFMRKFAPVRIVAVLALAGSAVIGAVLATGGVSAASKAPVAATCSALSGSTTVSIEVGGSASSLISGCSGGKATSQGIAVSTLNSDLNGGTGTIFWTNNKTTTYDYAVASTTGLSCGTYLNLDASGQETVTVSDLGGNAKVTAGGSFNVCYWNTSDGTVYERSVGTVTY